MDIKIKQYSYEVVNIKNVVIKGKMYSPNLSYCENELINKGFKIKKIKELNNIGAKLNTISIGKVLKASDHLFYLKQLSSLLVGGIRVSMACEILASQQEKGTIKKIYYAIYFDLMNGYSLSSAMERRGKNNFPKFMIKMIAVGETSGALQKVLSNLAVYYEKRNKTIKAIKGAFTMPIVYIILTVVVAIVLILAVIPNFENMFEDLGGDLPLATKAFISLSNFIKKYIFWIIISFFTTITLIYYAYKKINGFKKSVHKLLIKVPKLGNLLKLSNITSISNTLAELLENHVRIQDALRITIDTIGNITYKEILFEAMKNVESGYKMSLAFEHHWAVEPIVPRMMSIGENSGEVNVMLKNLAKYYNENIDDKVETLKKTIEPILLMFVYLVIGLMIFAILMPMLTIMQQV